MKVLDVSRTPEVVVLEDEEHVPVQLVTHERHGAGRDVRIDVHARCIDQIRGDRPQLGGERPHYRFLPFARLA